ncbi:MAG: ATP-dependent Clp protease proteolytic subunit [Caldisphaeraceae archaeon]|nr:ATP-dependent Clp protease proteolytic subunit [Caldisphaeraceae archaeon]MEB3692609.1 ATP-dependent Clp protease proteolytic subunit [Caldisphaeraceae archaeon]MEB3798547.1 ATP-dependent Clp protease proteolytic subunit [Caldisphaeraceae archaeon]
MNKKKVVAVLLSIAAVTTLAFIATVQHAASSKRPIIIVEFNDPVNVGSSDMMVRALAVAKAYDARAIVIVMNTPGGYLSDMVKIINVIGDANKSGIATYTFVPPNSLAASAGSYIAMATNGIIMGDGSEIGPSTPIVVGGTPLEQNHTEDAMISLMESLAQEWGRNVTAARDMVLYDMAFTAKQAYEYHLIDGISNSMEHALSFWNLSNAPEVTIKENVYEQLLSVLSNSVLDGILMTLGILAILLDIYHPTIILTIFGILAIIAGLVGAEVINASILGISLIVIGSAIMFSELKLGHGFSLMVGVIIAAVGVYLLSQGIPYISSGVPNGYTTQLEVVGLGSVGILAGLYVRWIAAPMRKKKKLAGPESLIGKKGVVVAPLRPVGEVRVEGIIWRAICSSCTAEVNDIVEVVAIEGIKLIVKKVT